MTRRLLSSHTENIPFECCVREEHNDFCALFVLLLLKNYEGNRCGQLGRMAKLCENRKKSFGGRKTVRCSPGKYRRERSDSCVLRVVRKVQQTGTEPEKFSQIIMSLVFESVEHQHLNKFDFKSLAPPSHRQVQFLWYPMTKGALLLCYSGK